MGMLDAFRRLLRLDGGPPAARCRDCGAGIPERDLAKGRAVVLARKAFCRTCVSARTTPGRSGLHAGLLDSTSRVTL